MTAPPVLVSGFCQFAMHGTCTGAVHGDPCGCPCHRPDSPPVTSRDRTTPPRDLSGEVAATGLVWVDVLIGSRRTAANLPVQTAAQFLRELADDLEQVQP